MKMHWEVHPGTGPLALFVHGFLMSRAQWLRNTAPLAGVCRPVVVELWGHGRSPAPDDPVAYAPDALVQTLDDIRSELSEARWLLCGYSLGAALTLRYALEHPERIIAHAWTNSTSALADSAQQNAWREQGLAGRQRFINDGIPAIERIAVHPRHAKHLPEDVRTPLLADASGHNPLGIANIMAYTTPELSVRDRIAHNSRPALLIQGQRETRFNPFADHAKAHMAMLEVAHLNTGHGVNMEDAPGFNAALAGFISRHSG
ncbi:MAG: alpha/beta fold hydrolase [Gammaproteobacteria bacterium]|nr:alpha/beta fold hydrolase [Gammaproteobacteria bacterium]